MASPPFADELLIGLLAGLAAGYIAKGEYSKIRIIFFGIWFVILSITYRMFYNSLILQSLIMLEIFFILFIKRKPVISYFEKLFPRKS